jgi:hypothetical protein
MSSDELSNYWKMLDIPVQLSLLTMVNKLVEVEKETLTVVEDPPEQKHHLIDEIPATPTTPNTPKPTITPNEKQQTQPIPNRKPTASTTRPNTTITPTPITTIIRNERRPENPNTPKRRRETKYDIYQFYKKAGKTSKNYTETQEDTAFKEYYKERINPSKRAFIAQGGENWADVADQQQYKAMSEKLCFHIKRPRDIGQFKYMYYSDDTFEKGRNAIKTDELGIKECLHKVITAKYKDSQKNNPTKTKRSDKTFNTVFVGFSKDDIVSQPNGTVLNIMVDSKIMKTINDVLNHHAESYIENGIHILVVGLKIKKNQKKAPSVNKPAVDIQTVDKSAFPTADINTLGDITASTLGEIYTTSNPTIVFKKLTGNETKKLDFLYKNAEKFINMESNYLVPPKTIITQDDVPVGYTMEISEGYSTFTDVKSFVDLDEFKNSLRRIIKGFRDMKLANLTPCRTTIVIKNEKVKLIELDNLQSCAENDESITLKQLETIFMNKQLPDNTFLIKLDNGQYKWTKNIKTFHAALQKLAPKKSTTTKSKATTTKSKATTTRDIARKIRGIYQTGYEFPAWVIDSERWDSFNFNTTEVFYHANDKLDDVKLLMRQREPCNMVYEGEIKRYYKKPELQQLVGYTQGAYNSQMPNFAVYCNATVKVGDIFKAVHVINLIGYLFNSPKQPDTKNITTIQELVVKYQRIWTLAFKCAEKLGCTHMVVPILGQSTGPKELKNENGLTIDVHSTFKDIIFTPSIETVHERSNVTAKLYKNTDNSFQFRLSKNQNESDQECEQRLRSTLYVNEWNPWSLIGNGNGKDKSLNGQWGRISNMSVLGWSATNPHLKYTAV